jgi:hypothetical protein
VGPLTYASPDHYLAVLARELSIRILLPKLPTFAHVHVLAVHNNWHPCFQMYKTIAGFKGVSNALPGLPPVIGFLPYIVILRHNMSVFSPRATLGGGGPCIDRSFFESNPTGWLSMRRNLKSSRRCALKWQYF